jgi:ATP-dependent protease HslVU (ClpYQ) ATPase subunit
VVEIEFPRIPYTGSTVSEKTSSRQFVNRDTLPLIEGYLVCSKKRNVFHTLLFLLLATRL